MFALYIILILILILPKADNITRQCYTLIANINDLINLTDIVLFNMMRDETRQALQKVDWTYQQFYITMRVTEDEAVELFVQNTETFEEYRQLIDSAFIDEHESLRLFDEPIDAFDHLLHHFAEVVVSEGMIELQYTTGKLKIKMKTIRLDMIKLQKDPLQLAKAKCERLQGDLFTKEAEVNQLSEQLKNMETINKQLICEFEEKQETIKLLLKDLKLSQTLRYGLEKRLDNRVLQQLGISQVKQDNLRVIDDLKTLLKNKEGIEKGNLNTIQQLTDNSKQLKKNIGQLNQRNSILQSKVDKLENQSKQQKAKIEELASKLKESQSKEVMKAPMKMPKEPKVKQQQQKKQKPVNVAQKKKNSEKQKKQESEWFDR